MNARDDAFKIRKALRDLTEPELILLVLHEFLDSVETKKNMRESDLNPSAIDLPIVDSLDIAQRVAKPDTEQALSCVLHEPPSRRV